MPGKTECCWIKRTGIDWGQGLRASVPIIVIMCCGDNQLTVSKNKFKRVSNCATFKRTAAKVCAN